MRARLLTYYITPGGGFELSGIPDECDIDIEDGDWHAGDRFDLPDNRKMFVIGKRNGVVTLRERRVYQSMEVAK